MSGRQYKSGFAKRKEKEKKDSEAEKGLSKMDSFVKRPQTLEPSVSDMASCSNAEPLEEQLDVDGPGKRKKTTSHWFTSWVVRK